MTEGKGRRRVIDGKRGVRGRGSEGKERERWSNN